MKTGRYIATHAVPLAPPFSAHEIPADTAFDVLGTDRDLVLIRFDGLRVWKPAAHLAGRTRRSAALPSVVGAKGAAAIPGLRFSLDDIFGVPHWGVMRHGGD
jgi:hypothetical protein